MQQSSSAYVASIDSLRALAVISVIVYHLHGSWLPGGFAGVDIFFVISGYVISRSLVGLESKGFMGFAGAFYGRRIRRILPALIVCLLTTSLLATVFVPNAWLSDSNQRTGHYAFWGLSNYALMSMGDPYFAPRIEFNPYVHTWSLGVEEQFYLLFPAIFYGWLRSRNSASRWYRAASNSLLMLLLLVSLGYCAYATRNLPLIGYYSLTSRFWELAAGAALLQLHDTGHRLGGRGAALERVQLALSVVLMIGCLCFANEADFPFPWAIAAVFGSLGVLDLATKDSAGAARINSWLSWAPAVAIGKISYSLYLWHWPVLVLWRWTVGLDGWSTKVTAVAVTFALAWASYAWIENPFRRGPLLRGIAPRWIIAGGLCCALCAWSADKLLDRAHRRLTLSVTRDVGTWYPTSGQHFNDIETNRKCVSPGPVATQGCDITGPARRLFMSGNSHALAYEPMVSMLESRGPFEVINYRQAGCALLPLDVPMTDHSSQCQRFYQSTLADMQMRLRPGDIVFLPSLRLPRLADQWTLYSETDALEQLYGEPGRQARQRALSEADGVLDSLVRRGAIVILEAPKPIFRAPAFRCSDWFNRGNPICAGGLAMPRDYLLHYRKPVLDAMIDLSRRHEHVLVWDPFDVLCPEASCEAVVNGVPLFFDADHLSSHGDRVVYSDFVAFLKTHSELPR